MGSEHGEWTARLLAGDVLDVAPRLLGAVIRQHSPEGTVGVRLSEVEAYDGSGLDPGSHAYRGRTPRTEVMFGPPAHLYVYFTYGMHWCANVVVGVDGHASAVLLRAGEVIEGADLAWRRRPTCAAARDLARGPARLTKALGLDGTQHGRPLHLDPAVVAAGDPARPQPGEVSLQVRRRRLPASLIRTGARVGVAGAGGDPQRYPWRFWIDGDPSVSLFRPGRAPSGAEPVRRAGTDASAGFAQRGGPVHPPVASTSVPHRHGQQSSRTGRHTRRPCRPAEHPAQSPEEFRPP